MVKPLYLRTQAAFLLASVSCSWLHVDELGLGQLYGLGGNRAADPTPRFDYDGEAIVQEVRPPEGAALVARHGPRPWLTNAIAWPGPVPPLELLAG